MMLYDVMMGSKVIELVCIYASLRKKGPIEVRTWI